MNRTRIIGPGRAGRSLGRALALAGWEEPEYLGRGDDMSRAAEGMDLVVIATSDDAIATIAKEITPVSTTLVIHLAGSLGVDVLAIHPRRGALHPLTALPDESLGAQRLVGAWFAVAGDEAVNEIVTALEGRAFTVGDDDRTTYHAAAVIASNHLVALLGQAERVAALADVPFDALLDLVRTTVANVDELGPAAALTGPAARGDGMTIERHLAALPANERATYAAMVAEARRLAGHARRSGE